MTDEDFEAACERITNLYRSKGIDQAVAERDIINAKLAPEYRLAFQGQKGGKMLGFTLHDLNTGETLKQTTKMWIS
jgi:hypothetical protein